MLGRQAAPERGKKPLIAAKELTVGVIYT